MVVINDFTSYFGEFVSKKITDFYSFDYWRSLAVAQADDRDAPAFTHTDFDFLGNSFQVVAVSTRSDEPNTGWKPPLFIEYLWSLKDLELNIIVYFESDEFRTCYIAKSPDYLEKQLGKDFDYIREFEKKVITLGALQGK